MTGISRGEGNRSLVGPVLLTLVGCTFVGLGILIFQAVIGGPFETPGQRHLGVRAVVAAGIGVVIGGALIYTAVNRRYWAG